MAGRVISMLNLHENWSSSPNSIEGENREFTGIWTVVLIVIKIIRMSPCKKAPKMTSGVEPAYRF